MIKLIPTVTPLYNAGFGVIGQPNFTSSVAATTQNGLYAPTGAAIDSAGNLYVADYGNNRVLMYQPPFSNGMNASVVIGQANFTSSVVATTQNGLSYPNGAAIDSAGNLYVADYGNNRVLMYQPPFSNDMNAAVVIGQPNFTSSGTATTQNGLTKPFGVATDSAGNLYIVDYDNNRVLIFQPPFSNGMNASVVIGQANFTSSVVATTQNGLSYPTGVAIDSAGNLYIVDHDNSRVMMYQPPFSSGMNASVVIGQANFTSSGTATTQNGLSYPFGVATDSAGNLYIVDYENSRVMMYQPPFSNGMNASVVIGQANFTSSGTATTQNGLSYPFGVATDSAGNLYVADDNNNRVMMYQPPFSNGMNAGDINQSGYSLVVYPNNRKNIFYTPNAGITKI